jgi:myo-inositol-1(or 4)-monophosphatase
MSAAPEIPERAELELIAADTARRAACIVAERVGRARLVGTKSSATDVVTETDLESEQLIRALLTRATPQAGIVGEEGGAHGLTQRVQWVVDPLDGTVNFLYGLPVCSVSIAAAVDGDFVAGAVVDVLRGETFSAHRGGGAHVDGVRVTPSDCDMLAGALVATGFSYAAPKRALQARIVSELLPRARDIRCFGSAALQLCWVGAGRIDAYFERDIKIWDWAAGALIAAEAGASVELPCPENDSLVLATTPAVFGPLRTIVMPPDRRAVR